jgi:hypothetical protein
MAAPAEPDARLEAKLRELTEALDRAEQENRRGRFLERMQGALDLDDVLARTLEAAHDLPGVDATMIVLPQGDGGPLVATQGMSRDEALNQPMSPPAEGRAPARRLAQLPLRRRGRRPRRQPDPRRAHGAAHGEPPGGRRHARRLLARPRARGRG